ncbi:MAG: hypothetical protein PHW02_06105 [bacterium]|nr:hypothetical protein [bacterium]
MKRFTLTAVMLVVLTAMALPMFAATDDATVDVQILIPSRVGIRINNAGAIVFDLTSVTLPTTFPGYYGATSAETEVLLDVFCNDNDGFNLDVDASGDFDADVPVSQLFFAPSGEALSAEGGAAGGNWTAFSSTATVSVLAAEPRPTGWTDYNQALEFMLEDTDPAVDPAVTVTLTYTITNI